MWCGSSVLDAAAPRCGLGRWPAGRCAARLRAMGAPPAPRGRRCPAARVLRRAVGASSPAAAASGPFCPPFGLCGCSPFGRFVHNRSARLMLNLVKFRPGSNSSGSDRKSRFARLLSALIVSLFFALRPLFRFVSPSPLRPLSGPAPTHRRVFGTSAKIPYLCAQDPALYPVWG